MTGGRPTTSADLAGQVGRRDDAGGDGVLEVVAHVGDAVGPGHHLALGRGRRGTVPGVVAHGVEGLGAQVERGQHDVGAVDGVVVAAGHEGREGVLAGVAGGAVAAVVAVAAAAVRATLSPAARAMDVATWATSMAWVSRVRRWSSSGAMKTWHLPARRRKGVACWMRSRSRSKQVRNAVGRLGPGRLPAPSARVAPGGQDVVRGRPPGPPLRAGPDPARRWRWARGHGEVIAGRTVARG